MHPCPEEQGATQHESARAQRMKAISMNARETKTVSQIITALQDGGPTLAMRLGSIRAAHVRIVMRDHGMTSEQAEASFASCRDAAEDRLAFEAKQAAEIAEELKQYACKCPICAPVVAPSVEHNKVEIDEMAKQLHAYGCNCIPCQIEIGKLPRPTTGALLVSVDHVTARCTDWGHLGTFMVKAGVHPLERKRIIKQAKQNGGIYEVNGSIHTIKFVC